MSTEMKTRGYNMLSKFIKDSKECEKVNTVLWKIYSSNTSEYLNSIYNMSLLKGDYKKLLNSITNIFESYLYTDCKTKQQERDDFITNPFTVEEGVMKCDKCGSKKTYSHQKQVRSADEGFTTFCYCVNCGAKWRIN